MAAAHHMPLDEAIASPVAMCDGRALGPAAWYALLTTVVAGPLFVAAPRPGVATVALLAGTGAAVHQLSLGLPGEFWAHALIGIMLAGCASHALSGDGGPVAVSKEESIKQMLKWLGYEPGWDKPTNFSFIFAYTKTDGQSEEQKQRNLLKMCERLGIRTTSVFNPSTKEHKEKIMAVAFPPTAPFCDIEKDYKRLQKVLFTTEAVTKPIPLQRSMCAIMSSLKFM